jgi:hypothetical protein
MRVSIPTISVGYRRLYRLQASLQAIGVSIGYRYYFLLIIVADLPVLQRSIQSIGISYSLQVIGFSCLLLRLLY